jgi:hypothetical protein
MSLVQAHVNNYTRLIQFVYNILYKYCQAAGNFGYAFDNNRYFSICSSCLQQSIRPHVHELRELIAKDAEICLGGEGVRRL